jgi:hypothetical protein
MGEKKFVTQVEFTKDQVEVINQWRTLVGGGNYVTVLSKISSSHFDILRLRRWFWSAEPHDARARSFRDSEILQQRYCAQRCCQSLMAGGATEYILNRPARSGVWFQTRTGFWPAHEGRISHSSPAYPGTLPMRSAASVHQGLCYRLMGRSDSARALPMADEVVRSGGSQTR